MQKLGRLLSTMIFQNVAALIALGIIRALFGVYGWWPNQRLFLLYDPMLNVLLPLLIGYTGGRLLGGKRGGVAAAFVTFGLVLSSSVPMIIGAMAIGPLTGWLVGEVNRRLENRIPLGFELFVANFFIAVIVTVLTVFSFTYLGQWLSSGIKVLNQWMETIIYSGWLPLVALLIEPLKVFFFNNLINHGILGPLGIQQAKELGKSIFFLLESNPGPGLGVLLAYIVKTKGGQRQAAKLSSVIHFFGGIHEVYFPYVLLRPALLLAVMLGGMTGIVVFQYTDAGLVSISSPGSILFLLALSPQDGMLSVLAGVILSALVSFVVSVFLLDPAPQSPTAEMKERELSDLERLQHMDEWNVQHAKKAFRKTENPPREEASFSPGIALRKKTAVRTIVFVCDAGMASSAMAAAMLKKKLKSEALDVAVKHSSIDDIPENADLIISHQNLTSRAKKVAPDREHLSIRSFTDSSFYERLVSYLRQEQGRPNGME